MAPGATVHRYEKVASHIRYLIDSGTYSPLQKLPSVRSLAAQLQVSITTVLEAYRVLEDQGRVEARPQSGYYVRSSPLLSLAQKAAEREIAVALEDPIEVGMGEFLLRHLKDFQRPELVQFGSACPNPDLLPNQRLTRALHRVSRASGSLGNRYDLPPGCEKLRIHIARRALQAGCVVSPEEVLLTLGCQEALVLALRATCQPGDTVAVESPTFYGHLKAIEMLGLKALEIPTDPIHGVSFAALRQSLEEVPIRALLLSPNFSNPTGASLSDPDKQELLEILARYDIPLIEDDTFGELGFSHQRPQAAKAFDRSDQVLLCSSFSKTLAPGYRVGWVLAGPRYMPKLHQLKLFSNLGSPVLPSLAIADFLQSGGFDHHLRQTRRLYASQVHHMREAVLDSFPDGTTVSCPRGGFVLWVELPLRLDSRLFYPRALQLGMTFGPGPIFSARGRFRNFMRLCAPYWSKENEPRLRALGDLLRKHH